MHSLTEASWPATVPAVRFAAFTPTSKEPLATHATEVFELHQAADFRRRWQAQLAATRPPLYLVFMLTDGEGLHRVGSEAFYVRPGMLGFLGPEALANWQPGPAAQQGYFCVFTEAFFNADRADQNLWRSLPFFATPDAAEALVAPPEAVGALLAQFAQLATDAQGGQPESAPLLRAQLTVLLLRAAACYRDAQPAAPCAGQRLTNAFLALLEEDLAPLLTGQPIEQATVRAYAQRLRVSQNHLNDTVRRYTGHSAGTLAHDALARVATDLLGQGHRPVHEVARLLGFTSATYFTRFYRHRIGHTPSQVRRRAAA